MTMFSLILNINNNALIFCDNASYFSVMEYNPQKQNILYFV